MNFLQSSAATKIRAMQADPNFPAAVIASASAAVGFYRRSRLSNFIFSDRTWSLLPYIVVYLHQSDGGLTVTRAKKLCAHMQLCSEGRAGAILGMMRLAGALEAGTATADRRARRLIPTEKLMAMLRERLRFQFEAITRVLPDMTLAVQKIGDADFERAFVANAGAQFVNGFRLENLAPDLKPFFDRNAGMMILFSLMLAGSRGNAVPPIQPVSVSIAELSRRFSVSRTHVLRVLRDAEQANLLERIHARTGSIRFKSALRQAMLDFFSAMFLFLHHNAMLALHTALPIAQMTQFSAEQEGQS